MKFRFTIGRKIGTGFGILILSTLAAFIFTNQTLKESRRINDKINQVYNPSLKALDELNKVVLISKPLISYWVNVQRSNEDPDKQKLRDNIFRDYPAVKGRIKGLSLRWRKDDRDSINDVFEKIDDLFHVHQEIMDTIKEFESYNDPLIIFFCGPLAETGGDIDLKTQAVQQKLSRIIERQNRDSKKINSDMLVSFKTLTTIVTSLGIALLIGGILIAIFTVRSIVRPISYLKKILISMGKGVLPNEKIKNRNDEIGEMSLALNDLVDGLRSTTDFAKEVGSGNFASEYNPLSDKDTLGHALLKMRSELDENERFLEAKVIERTEEVVKQKEEIESKNQILEVLYKQVTDSIRYAKRIQEAILPPQSILRIILPNSFILFKPKDIVSGDFYWVEQKNGKTLFSAVDCTGHGVPGAFMSIVAYNILKYVVNNNNETQPARILDALNIGVSETLHQSNSESQSRDGMDLALCAIDFAKKELQFAGAYNPLYLIRKGQLLEFKADKFPIGYYTGTTAKPYKNNVIDLQSGDMIYIFSDGYVDQFGGPNGKKYMANRFRNLLLEICEKPVEEQKKILDNQLLDWQGVHEQVDDILVIGLKIS
ncbi:MAG TPA: SpoIIE family protein phosphatase [Bacteroidia bacterium]|nr:SpoIIE family protein phosphatase [Bacteroidia bacterium]HRH09069.1 SpoIIE family protein phosphatase [Bacteroidia bacterium]HRH63252.1 SpoIIE family protein phosphatase [Bacteroidia bacterium]